MSITLGYPRKHVWTYAIGISDGGSNVNYAYCPCAAIRGTDPPSFVRNHFYCESGNMSNYDFSEYILHHRPGVGWIRISRICK